MRLYDYFYYKVWESVRGGGISISLGVCVVMPEAWMILLRGVVPFAPPCSAPPLGPTPPGARGAHLLLVC